MKSFLMKGFDSNGRFYDKTGTFYPDETGNLWNNEYFLINFLKLN